MKTTLTNEELAEKCETLISALCKNPGAWTMRVPVDVNNDSDVILSELVNRFKGVSAYLVPLATAAQNFVNRVENGKAKSVKSYNEFKTALANLEINSPTNKFYQLFLDVFTESNRAKAKFGEQLDIPSVVESPIPYTALHEFYGLRSEELAKYLTNRAMSENSLTWGHVAVEELAEVIGCKDEATRRVELIQLMSVCARWIAAIDWQTEYNKETKKQIGE